MGIFTQHVQALGRGEPPPDHELARLWRALRAALRSELNRRGLWGLAPSYLGMVGWRSWSERGDQAGAAAPPRESALDELTADCYAFVFVDRLQSLAAQLGLKPEIDGLVALNVRHFIHERQREHDPLGYRVFDVLRSALRQALDAGELHLLGGDPRVQNDTVLGFRSSATTPPTPGPDLRALVGRWNDEILPDLATTQGKKRSDVAGRLRRRLPELRGEGIEAFRLRDLAEPLKRDARARWAALLGQAAGDVVWRQGRAETGGAVRMAPPDTGVDDRESFDHLVRGVAESLRRLEVDDRTRGYLASLWHYLSRWASEPADLATRPWRERDAAPGPATVEINRLSHRKITRQLGIPRERLPELFAILEHMIEECRANSGSRQPGGDSRGDRGHGSQRRRGGAGAGAKPSRRR